MVGMLAAMPPAPSNRPDPDETPVTSATPVRDRGDACPGALRLHSADDGALARVRVPAGVLSAAQAYALADAAERLGDGALDITSRGNLQLRGLEPGCAGELARLLDTAGLLPAPRHERVRNVVASPLSGLDGRGHLDVQPLVRELDALLCASERAPELSGRFLFALDDGRGDMAEFAADVMLLAQPGGAAVRVSVGGAAVRVRAEDGPRAMLLAAEAFLDAASATGTRAWRVRELPRSGTELADVPAWREHFSGPVGSVDAAGPGGPVGSGVPEGAAVSPRRLRPPAPAARAPYPCR
jgi:precorrin-3B synthase